MILRVKVISSVVSGNIIVQLPIKSKQVNCFVRKIHCGVNWHMYDSPKWA